MTDELKYGRVGSVKTGLKLRLYSCGSCHLMSLSVDLLYIWRLKQIRHYHHSCCYHNHQYYFVFDIFRCVLTYEETPLKLLHRRFYITLY